MNKKLMTMLVACALSVSALSTTAVFAEDAAVTGETPAVTETTTTPETTPVAYEPEITLITPKWTGDSDIVFEVDAKGEQFILRKCMFMVQMTQQCLLSVFHLW